MITRDWIRAYIAKKIEEALIGLRSHCGSAGGPREVLIATEHRDQAYGIAMRSADSVLLELGIVSAPKDPRFSKTRRAMAKSRKRLRGEPRAQAKRIHNRVMGASTADRVQIAPVILGTE